MFGLFMHLASTAKCPAWHAIGRSLAACWFVFRLRLLCVTCSGPLLCRAGTVISLVTPGEAFVVRKLARRLNIAIDEAELAAGTFRRVDSH